MRFLTTFTIFLAIPLLCNGQYNQQRKGSLYTNHMVPGLNLNRSFSTPPEKSILHSSFTTNSYITNYNHSSPANLVTPQTTPYKSVLLENSFYQNRNSYKRDPALKSGTLEPFIRTALSLMTGKEY